MEDMGKLIAELRTMRDKISAAKAKAAAKIAPLEDMERNLETKLIAAMQGGGTTMARTTGFSASLEEQLLPRIVDSKRFDRYCKQHNALHLYERRVARTNFAEWVTAHPELRDPAKIGVDIFKKHTIRINKLGDKNG